MGEKKSLSYRQRLLRWRENNVTDQVFQFVAAAVVGLFTGIAAFILKWLIGKVGLLLTHNFNPVSFNYLFLVFPLAGIMLTGIFQRYLLHRQIDHGVKRLLTAMELKHYDIPFAMIWAYIIGSTLTLGFGGSAGAEGPIASSGAAIGSNIARWLKMRPAMLRILIGCGAGAGIAGIFKAPVGGVLFTLEVMKLEMTTVSVMALFASCIVSSMTAYSLSNLTVDMSYLQISQFEPATVPYIILLGVVCGIYSLYYATVMGWMQRFFDSIKNSWLKNLLSGTILSVILFFFPAMFGEGYNMMGHLLNGEINAIGNYSAIFSNPDRWSDMIMICLFVCALKAFATASSNSGGGIAGDFAPTLFAGCFVGFTFAAIINHFFGVSLPSAAFAFMGMAGVMAGAIRAPYMALFITAEMTNGFVLFLPLMGVTAISYGIVRLFKGNSYYNDPAFKSWQRLAKKTKTD